jgi:hypothetical protein
MKMMDKQPIIETANNFDAVNEHIDNLAIRQRDLLTFQKLSKFRNLVISVAILFIALSIAYLIYSYATRLPSAGTMGDVANISNVLDRARGGRSLESIVGPDSDVESAAKISVDFTVFSTIKIDDDAGIVTGWSYDPANLEVPNREYCYYNLTVADNKQAITHIAEKNEGEAIVWANLSPEMQKLGEENCRFYK